MTATIPPYFYTQGVTRIEAATATIDPEVHAGRPIVVDRAAGSTLTLPAATGSGLHFRIMLQTTITSNSLVVQVVGDDVMVGHANLLNSAANEVFAAGASDDTITMNGSTTGGIAGAVIDLLDIEADTWFVRVESQATGTEATPFSAAVS